MKKRIDICSEANNLGANRGVCRFGLIKELIQKHFEGRLNDLGCKGLSPNHASVLIRLHEGGGTIQMKLLSEGMGKSKSTVSELVSRLDQEGLTRRCECTMDGRVCYVALTERGADIAARLADASQEISRQIFQGFTSSERELLEDLLNRIIANLS